MNSWRTHYKKALIALSLLLCTSVSIYAQDASKGDPENGETLFKANCAACHALDKQLVGPALGGVVDRVKQEENLDVDWFYKWIKDNKALRTSGDKYANELFEKFNKTEMPVFANLSDQDVDDILAYTTNPPKQDDAAATTADKAQDPAQLEAERTEKTNSLIILVSLLAVSGLLVWLLIKLRQLVKLNQSEELSVFNECQIRNFGELYEKYNTIGKLVLGILAVFAAYGVWNWLMWVGVYKGYQPEQPIYFSHKIHAGINKIDCQLCHSGAKYGKVSEIPSLNVCMNCHKFISEYKGEYVQAGKTKDFYTGEIKKIYDAVGWDEKTQSYTGKTHPIQWVRIHNMPDFVYFNHSQHVVAGAKTIMAAKNVDIVCKACHGKIDTMNVVQMANDFTMGWCISCHRTTQVDMTNGYNEAYFKNLHAKLEKQYGKGTKITVDAIGGIECGKCHY
ncbi:c-type cytochrome [Riemerella columbipharyngis]|uniref:Cytochrome c, mono-and diheme variants n=1 Tax=Riemerella columbipharyngis TaxID=1071918 RepID=A0A1G7EDK4_9FLAO|nr:c-type cytochrome [Riemerella columbipharyngis]SDE61748.1 Cytochrome c, mono-and diheme variants [Riemerella columbipharyngis]